LATVAYLQGVCVFVCVSVCVCVYTYIYVYLYVGVDSRGVGNLKQLLVTVMKVLYTHVSSSSHITPILYRGQFTHISSSSHRHISSSSHITPILYRGQFTGLRQPQPPSLLVTVMKF